MSDKPETKKAVVKKAKATTYRGVVATDFKIEGKIYVRGESYSTKSKPLFDKLIRIFKILKK